jgi:phosphinothricin acetyltransferase
MTVRTAEEADVPAIAAIYAHHVVLGTGTFETEPPDEQEMVRRWQSVRSAGLPWLVAEDGEIAGYAYAAPYRPRPAYRFTVENSVYVRSDFAGRGAGSCLMTELLAQCTSLDLRQMIAVIGDSENAASIALHRKFGFERVGVLKNVGFKFERWLDTVIMQRTLSGA